MQKIIIIVFVVFHDFTYLRLVGVDPTPQTLSILKTNQNGVFLSFRHKIAIEKLLILRKSARNLLHMTI